MKHGFVVFANDGNCISYLSGTGRFVLTKRLAWRYDSYDDAKIVADSFAALEDFLHPCARYYVKEV